MENPTKEEILSKFDELNYEVDKLKFLIASCPNTQLVAPVNELIQRHTELEKIRPMLTIEDFNKN